MTFIYRELARNSGRDDFDKGFVEKNILSWMPFDVSKTYASLNVQEN